jgi:hypothetical protein
MCKCIFSFVNNQLDYNNIKKDRLDTIFSDKNYGENCLVLNKKIDIFDCFFYLYKNNNYDTYIFYTSKGNLKSKFDDLFFDENYYLNYYDNFIYFLKYNKNLYKIFELFDHNINSDNIINFLSDYYSSFDYKINENLDGKFAFPRNKLIYNAFKGLSVIQKK